MGKIPVLSILIAVSALLSCSRQFSPADVETCAREKAGALALGDFSVLYRDARGLLKTVHGGNPLRAWLWNHLEVPAASLTKPIIAHRISLAFYGRYETGAFDEADIANNPALGEIALLHLLTHTSGLLNLAADPLWLSSGRGFEADCQVATSVISRQSPSFPPGQHTHYLNAGYCRLGQLLEGMHLPKRLDRALASGLGGAGGWRSTLPELYQALEATLPASHLNDASNLPDGSHYDIAWRHWPADGGAPWTHFGLLHTDPVFTVAMHEGSDGLVLAYYRSTPVDSEAAAHHLRTALWGCFHE